jgi:hypothetical protein
VRKFLKHFAFIQIAAEPMRCLVVVDMESIARFFNLSIHDQEKGKPGD